MTNPLQERAQQLDAQDPLAHFRDRFHLPEGLVYLDGNSLGPLPRETTQRINQMLVEEWGQGLIGSWNEADWIDAPRRVGDKIGKLIGAKKGETIVADSVSVNIFKALTAALSLQSGRSTILTEDGNFPTDHYMMQGLARFATDKVNYRAVPREALPDSLDETTAVLLLTHVHYKTGEMWDMQSVSRAVHDAGALVIWDLSHSTGAVELDLSACEADFAVGCGYKYLNGGPGAPAFINVAERHHGAAPVLSGWFGHARPFAFEQGYEPAAGIERFLCGTPGILGLAALECGVDLKMEAESAAVRAKSLALGDMLIEAMAPLCDKYGFVLETPRGHSERGSHVSFGHEHAYAITQALKARGVVGDYREAGTLRLGLTPLTLRYQDVVEAVVRLEAVCAQREWDAPHYHARARVT